ncbi:MAG: CehA/McbA family metallohydrolase [Lentisphaeria bacterium]|nr:CehA/McbA family metallohydrolase [Lentisphaeria bacterium]
MSNPFAARGQWLKANLHTHTTQSDGDATPAQRVEQYLRQGYDVLAITDHRTVTPIEPIARDGMVLLRGIELHPACPDGPLYHLVGLNMGAEFRADETLTAQETIDAVRASGGEVVVAHPYWCGHTVPQITALRDVCAIEVYNATCTKIGKGDSSMFWDYCLATGSRLPAVAVDDTHRGRDIFMGWTMIKAVSRSPADILAGLCQGLCYASCGPEILDFAWEDGEMRVACTPVREIHFLCRGSCGRSFYADADKELTAAAWRPPATAGYARVQCVDGEGRCAWLNPVSVP